MNLRNKVSVIIIYIFTLYFANRNLLVSLDNAKNALVTYDEFNLILILIIAILVLVLMFFNSKSGLTDVLTLIFVYILSLIYVNLTFELSGISICFNLLLSIMFAKYINIEARDHSFVWLNVWTYFGFSIFLFMIFIGVFSLLSGFVFAYIFLKVLINEEEKLKKEPSSIKSVVRNETIIFFIGINMLFIVEIIGGK